MKNMFIEVVENSKGNSGLRLSLNESDGDKIEGMKFCELLVAHVPADNFYKFVESIVEQACFNRNTHQKILRAIRSIAEQYEEMVEEENKPIIFCPKCESLVWDVATIDQALNKCWVCGLRWMNDIVDDEKEV